MPHAGFAGSNATFPMMSLVSNTFRGAVFPTQLSTTNPISDSNIIRKNTLYIKYSVLNEFCEAEIPVKLNEEYFKNR